MVLFAEKQRYTSLDSISEIDSREQNYDECLRYCGRHSLNVTKH